MSLENKIEDTVQQTDPEVGYHERHAEFLFSAHICRDRIGQKVTKTNMRTISTFASDYEGKHVHARILSDW